MGSLTRGSDMGSTPWQPSCEGSPLGIPPLTVASRLLGHDGAAAHFPDVPRAWRRLQAEAGEDERESMRESARTELERRREGRDEFRLQPKPAGADTAATCDLLVPLNYRSDTAALCR